MTNVLSIQFGGLRNLVSPQHLTQWDYGQVIMPVGIDLPESYNVDFSYTSRSEAIPAIGTSSGGIPIPDAALSGSGNLHVWITLHNGPDDGKTVYHVVIPVDARAKPGDVRGSEDDKSALHTAIALLSEATDRAEAAASEAEDYSGRYPKLVDGIWWLFNPETNEWVNTGVSGVGVGIKSLTYNSDYTITFTLDDGRTYTTGNIRGEKGAFPDVDSELLDDSTNPVENRAVAEALKEKQNNLTFDSVPTENSTNPVTSGGIYNALSGIQQSLEFDSAPTEESLNPVTSGGIYSALQGKQDTLTIDDVLSSESENPVQNKAIQGGLDLKVDKEQGKGLSTNDFTDEMESELDRLSSGLTPNTLTLGGTTIHEGDLKFLLSLVDGDSIEYGDPTSPLVNVGEADEMIAVDGHEEENTIDIGEIGYMILQHPENSIFIGTAIVGESAIAE